jgi:hypothetical protein
VQVQRLHPAQERRRRRRAAGRDGHALLEPPGGRMAHDAQVDRRGAAVVRDALGLEQLPDPLGLHPAQAHVAPADRGDRPGQAPPVAVEHRQRPQMHRAGAHPRLQRDAVGPQVGAAVGVHRALRAARRARGVVDRDRVVLGSRVRDDRVGLAHGEEVLVRVARRARVLHHHDPHPGRVRLLGQRDERVVDEEDLGRAVPEDVGHLRSAQARVERDEDRAEGGHGVVGLEDRRGVRRQHRHTISPLHPGPPQRRRQAPRPLAEVGVAIAPLAVDHRDPLGHHLHGVVQEVQRAELAAGRAIHHGRQIPRRSVGHGDGSRMLRRRSWPAHRSRRRGEHVPYPRSVSGPPGTRWRARSR